MLTENTESGGQEFLFQTIKGTGFQGAGPTKTPLSTNFCFRCSSQHCLNTTAK